MSKMTRREAIRKAAIAAGVLLTAGTVTAAECGSCKGSGTGPFTCTFCKGTGVKDKFKCSFCNGKGFPKCSSCNGTGQKR